MSQKRTLYYQSIVNGDMSAGIVSQPTDISYLDNVGIEVSWTGSPSGSIYIDGSNSGSNWVPFTFSGQAVAAGVPDSTSFSLIGCPFKMVRIRYVPTGGTGTLNAFLMAKQSGG